MVWDVPPLESMKRALPEQFPENSRNHGVVPTQGQFLGKWRGSCLACALGIEVIDGSDIDHDSSPLSLSERPAELG